MCSGTTEAIKALFSDLQTQANRILATLPTSAPALVVDGKLGRNTVAQLATIGSMAAAPSYGAFSLPNLRGYGVKAPGPSVVAASADAINRELKVFADVREREAAQNIVDPAAGVIASLGPAADAAQKIADEAQKTATAAVVGCGGADTPCAQQYAKTAADAAAAAEIARLKTIVAGTHSFALPAITGKKNVDYAIYGIGAAAVAWASYRAYQKRRSPVRAPATSPVATAIAGLFGLRRPRSRR